MGTTTLTEPKPTTRADDKGRGGGSGFGGGDGFGGDSGRHGEWCVPERTYRMGVWLALVAVVMLFAAFTSALVVRQGLGENWGSTPLPRILWLNTLVLLASSATLEFSRRSLARRAPESFSIWLHVTAGLGVIFLVGQLAAWRELAARGFYLASNASASFLYLLTATHALHLLGGVVALGYVVLRSGAIARGNQRRVALDATAIYWHFMDGLWIYILILLSTRL
ncbi:MAG: heme-copper oxidase subunit III [Acidobacteria bacterium]|nr:heme-copper oxidase subunit III [Acidobacteriota bacterium]